MFPVAVLVAILTLLTLPSPASARSDAERLALKGRVKQVVTERASFSDHDGVWAQEPSVGISTQAFDPEGWLIESDEHDPRVFPHSRTKVTQQPDGSTTRDTQWSAEDGSLLNKYVETYDSRRRLIGASEFAADGSLRWTEGVTVNSLDETIQERVAADGSLIHRASWFDAQSGFRVVDITTFQEGSPVSWSRIEYNRNGRITRAQNYGNEGQPGDLLVVDDEPDGRPRASIRYAADGVMRSRQTQSYDIDGHQTKGTESSYDSDDQEPSKMEYATIPAGFETGAPPAIKGRVSLQFVYDVDEQGNWIRQTTWHCGPKQDESSGWWQDANPCEVTTRTITYYAETPDGGHGTLTAQRGTLIGKVTFEGVPPAPKKNDLSKFPNSAFCAKAESDGRGNRLIQEVNVGTDHALRDVVIAVQDVPMEKPFEFAGTRVNAEGCKWLVQGGPSTLVGVVVRKKEIAIENMDADPDDPKALRGVLYSPHAYEVFGGNNTTIFNLPLPEKGQIVRKPVILRQQGSTLLLEGDQKNYMQAYFLPVENPYYAIVEHDGTFTIRDIPPGTYTVLAWHPKLGKQEATVTVTSNSSVRADFSFAAKERGE
jgi:hypothetical protein